MKKAIHSKSIYRSNLATDMKVAKESGFQYMEIVATKIVSYLEQFTIEDLKNLLKENSIIPASINDIAHVERTELEEIERMLKEAEYFSSIAKAIGCPTIQLVPVCALEGRPWEEILKITSDNIRRICDIGSKYGVRFQLEPVAWSPIHSLSQSLELIKLVDRDNLGMVIDFWHLWSGGETVPEEVAKLDKSQIYNIHFCDGKKQAKGTLCDETILRGVYPGEGDIPLKDWVDAVKMTGYDGVWACELISAKHWECNVFEVASVLSKKMDEYIL